MALTAYGSDSTTDDITAVAAVAGSKIRVHALRMHSASSVAVSVYDGTSAGTLLIVPTVNTAFDWDAGPGAYLFETTAGNAFTLDCGSAVQLEWQVTYTVMP